MINLKEFPLTKAITIPVVAHGDDVNLPPWYFPGLTADQCRQALRGGADGSFVVRVDPVEKKQFISVVRSGRVYHHVFERNGEPLRVRVFGGGSLSSLSFPSHRCPLPFSAPT